MQPDTAAWKVPSLAMLRGTTLGAADYTFYWPFKGPRVTVQDGKRTPVPPDQWRTLRMEDQFDALLYLGRPSELTIARVPRSLCADAEYMKMRLGRLTMLGMQDRPPPAPSACTSWKQRARSCALPIGRFMFSSATVITR